MAGPLDQIVVIKLRSTQPGPQRGLALWAVMRARCRYVNDVQIRGDLYVQDGCPTVAHAGAAGRLGTAHCGGACHQK
jgi:hypothetical protein